MKYPIVRILWNDHYEVSDWQPVDGYSAENHIHDSVGFLVKKTRTHYVIARTLTPDGMMDGVMNIIRKNVTSFEVIFAV